MNLQERFALLPEKTQMELLEAAHLLQPHAASPLLAAQWFLEKAPRNLLPEDHSRTVGEIIEKMIAEKKEKRRPRTVEDLQNRLTHFAESFPDRPLASLSKTEIEKYIKELENKSDRTRVNALTKISQLYHYAIRNHWVLVNQARKVVWPQADAPQPHCFQPEECRVLLEKSAPLGLRPYIALSLFAGLASNEILRLHWPHLHWSAKEIEIVADVAKNHKRRLVPMLDPLRAWLRPYQLSQGGVVYLEKIFRATSFAHAMRKLAQHLDRKTWPFNGLANTFATYHLAQFHDPHKTAEILGLESIQPLHRFMRVPTTAKKTNEFWRLHPSD